MRGFLAGWGTGIPALWTTPRGPTAGMRRLLASDLLAQRAGQPVKALVHIPFADLCQLDTDSALQEQWITGYRARWAAHRAAASVSTGDGGAWLDGDKARAIVCDAMIIPVVTGDVDAKARWRSSSACASATTPSAPRTPPPTRTGPAPKTAPTSRPHRPPDRAGRPIRHRGRRAGRDGTPDPGQDPPGPLRAGRGGLVHAPPAARQAPGTSQVRSPAGKTIHSHAPPPRPG